VLVLGYLDGAVDALVSTMAGPDHQQRFEQPRDSQALDETGYAGALQKVFEAEDITKAPECETLGEDVQPRSLETFLCPAPRSSPSSSPSSASASASAEEVLVDGPARVVRAPWTFEGFPAREAHAYKVVLKFRRTKGALVRRPAFTFCGGRAQAARVLEDLRLAEEFPSEYPLLWGVGTRTLLGRIKAVRIEVPFELVGGLMAYVPYSSYNGARYLNGLFDMVRGDGEAKALERYPFVVRGPARVMSPKTLVAFSKIVALHRKLRGDDVPTNDRVAVWADPNESTRSSIAPAVRFPWLACRKAGPIIKLIEGKAYEAPAGGVVTPTWADSAGASRTRTAPDAPKAKRARPTSLPFGATVARTLFVDADTETLTQRQLTPPTPAPTAVEKVAQGFDLTRLRLEDGDVQVE
jgi:hypothetical protein